MNLQAITESTGWRRRGWAVLFGICATAALPPVYALPLVIPAVAGLFLLVIHAPTRRQAFLDGWWWGLGHFVTGLYWMCISLYVEPDKFAWLTPFALLGVPSVLAIYIGLVTLGLSYMGGTLPPISFHEISPAGSSYKTPPRIHAPYLIIAFAILWVIAEYARAHLFTGFPWNLIGYVWTLSDVTLQFASVVGVYGLSFLTVLCATMPVLFILKSPSARTANIAVVILLFAMCVFGGWRLSSHPTEYTSTTLRIVQANIEQSLKINPKTEFDALKKHVSLTRSPGLDNADIVIWPETAVPYYMQAHSALTRDLGAILPQKTILITGGMRAEGNEKAWKAWNSVFAIDHSGAVISAYDKHHLVPFGEYIPFRHILPVEAIAGGHGDFETGAGESTLTSGTYPPYSPLICYEAIFPDEATDNTHAAQWLLNVTNDAWFGASSGPYQHLQMARMRAVEQGLPLVRAANTGVSAVFDAYGRMVAHIPLGKEGIIDTALPAYLPEGVISSRYPLNTIILVVVLSAAFLVMGRKNIL